MDEKITPSKKAIALILTIGVAIGFAFLFYNYYIKELTWKQTVKEYTEKVRFGHSYYDGNRTTELILLLNEKGFESYGVNAFALKGFCIVEADTNNLSNKLKLKIFNECLEPVKYIKLIAIDGNYFINAWAGEYVPKALARGEKKAIVVENEEI